MDFLNISQNIYCKSKEIYKNYLTIKLLLKLHNPWERPNIHIQTLKKKKKKKKQPRQA